MKENLTYVSALAEAANGFRIRRACWPEGMWIWQADSGTFRLNKLVMGDLGQFLVVRSSKGDFNVCYPSVDDMGAEDWTAFV